MKQLINDLLEYSRVFTRGGEAAQTSIAELFQEVRCDLEVAVSELSARVEAEGQLPDVVCDRSQIRRVLQNLVSNALKFHRAGVPPVVKLSSRRLETGGEWELSVSDNGIGIEERFFDRIFRIFQRLHASDQYPGTGIGLAVCNRIVQRHGGRFSVESEPGAGTVFRFTIPDNPVLEGEVVQGVTT